MPLLAAIALLSAWAPRAIAESAWRSAGKPHVTVETSPARRLDNAGTSGVLRWRAISKARPTTTINSTAPAPSSWETADKSDSAKATPRSTAVLKQSPVMPAAFEEEVNPFDDPFGDRQQQSVLKQVESPSSDTQQGPSLATGPRLAQQGDARRQPSRFGRPDIDALLEPRNDRGAAGEVEPSQPSAEPGQSGTDLYPGQRSRFSRDDEDGAAATPADNSGDDSPLRPRPLDVDDLLQDRQDNSGSDATAGDAGTDDAGSGYDTDEDFLNPRGLRREEPCDRKYNGYNCCKQEEDCAEEFQKLATKSIRDISVDITPSINPQLETEKEREQFKIKRMAKVPFRAFMDRNGQLLGSGRMVDYENGYVVLETQSGSHKHIPFNDLGRDEVCFVSAWWGIPVDCVPGEGHRNYRNWTMITYTWKASGLVHKPLYFEQIQLERYGHSLGPVLQPIASGAHFFGSTLVLPYKMGMHPPNECRYALGYYRPGSCAPYLLPPVPISLRGAAAQTAAVLGAVYLLP